jgi:hypothetical protein
MTHDQGIVDDLTWADASAGKVPRSGPLLAGDASDGLDRDAPRR